MSGAITGAVDLPVDVGPEVILDAAALDAGGIAYSVFTKAGVRVERHRCDEERPVTDSPSSP